MNSRTAPEPVAPSGGGGLVRVRPDRYRLDVAYDGTDFSGWATQPTRRSVQQTLEQALARVLRLDDAPRLVVAGRTDAGVHATGQVCHLDLPEGAGRADLVAPLDGHRLRRGLNGVLPPDVRVLAVTVAPEGFDARFSALARRYAYRIVEQVGDPLRRTDTVTWPRTLDVAAMRAACPPLLGEHDFAAFCKRREGATTIRRLLGLSWDRDEAGVLTCTVEADAFCHSMVRALVGALTAVGEGRRAPTWPQEVLRAVVRDSSVPVAPAHGLTLLEVRYPPDDELASRALVTRQLRVAVEQEET